LFKVLFKTLKRYNGGYSELKLLGTPDCRAADSGNTRCDDNTAVAWNTGLCRRRSKDKTPFANEAYQGFYGRRY